MRALVVPGVEPVSVLVQQALELLALGELRDTQGHLPTPITVFWDLVRESATPVQQQEIVGPPS
jgi:hypothetical protein